MYLSHKSPSCNPTVTLAIQSLNNRQPAAARSLQPDSVPTASDNGPFDDIDPSRTSPSPVRAPANGGNLPTDGTENAHFTTLEVSTTFTTTGVFTTEVTTTLPNGQVRTTSAIVTGTRTITTETEVVTQVGTLSAKGGPPKELIGGVIGATVIVILAVIALCILRCRRRRQSSQVFSETRPHSPQRRTSLRPRPFLEPQIALTNISPESKIKEKSQASSSPSTREQAQDPFRDPEVVDRVETPNDQQNEVQRARDALDRLQQLTNQLEVELEHLNNLARLGRLSDDDQARLDEIRRTTGLTIPFNPRQGHMSTDSSASGFSVPPSYHTNCSA
ncbi:hypothetical protein D9756_006107 [Leucocoprinus leucothites]|uniref:Uncharacterized protein n=1 Tax=Leucocoprinus leucothites TaxID=201217 RepID=A0A8H5FX00_9AGAR|nr:hypothetical protein D9756_006107 [Leucoagaricus leucothites]